MGGCAIACTAGLLLAVLAPSVFADNDDRGRHGDRGGYGDRGGHHGQSVRERRHEWRNDGGAYTYRPQYNAPYYYSAPVYVPPPVYYAPRQSPGISLFFPLDLR